MAWYCQDFIRHDNNIMEQWSLYPIYRGRYGVAFVALLCSHTPPFLAKQWTEAPRRRQEEEFALQIDHSSRLQHLMLPDVHFLQTGCEFLVTFDFTFSLLGFAGGPCNPQRQKQPPPLDSPKLTTLCISYFLTLKASEYFELMITLWFDYIGSRPMNAHSP